jgi:hypothetical protein
MQQNDNDDPELRIIRALVAGNGIAVRDTVTSPVAGSQHYAYTIGLTGLGRPEILIAGDPPVFFPGLIAAVIMHAVDTEKPPLVPGHFDLGEDDGTLRFAVTGPVDASDYPLRYLADVYPCAGLPLQVVWPDEHRKFPWETGYDMSLRQPLLGTIPGSDAFHLPDGFILRPPQRRPPGRDPQKKPPTGPSNKP